MIAAADKDVGLNETEEEKDINLLKRCDRWDRKISSYIFNLELGILDYVIIIPTLLFGTQGIPLTSLYVLLHRGYKSVIYLFFPCILTVLTSEVLKHTTKRHRPEVGVIKKRRIPIRKNYVNFSFPSGDSAQAGAILYFLYLAHANHIYLFLILCAMFGRIYFGCHYVSDTIFGASLGIFYTFIYHFINQNIFLPLSQGNHPSLYIWLSQFSSN